MKGLKTLIKLSKRNLDELRRAMASLENQKDQLLKLSQKLKQELASEITMASKNPEMSHFFGGFAKRIQQRQEGIAKEVATLDKQMAVLNTQIIEAFAEQKKYEIALANAEKRIKAKKEKRESLELDEIAGQRFRRQTEETE